MVCRSPCTAGPLVCLDEPERSGDSRVQFCKQLIGQAHEVVPAQPGQPTRQDYEYIRHGMCSVFMAYSPLESWREVRVTGQRTAHHYAQTIRWLCDEVYPHADKIVLVRDNLNTHTPASLYEAFAPAEALRLKECIEWHYTPKHGSWLNMAEIEIGVAQRQCLSRRIPQKANVEKELRRWSQERNAVNASTDWQFTTANARTKLKRLYPSSTQE
jgi:hypothetical protein